MEGFADLLEEIRASGGELMWILKKKEFLENTTNQKRTPNELKKLVLQSQRIRHVVDQLHEKQPEISKADIMAEAAKIMNEMCHQFNLKYVRSLGYVVIKVLSKIFKHIYYNTSINANLKVLKTHPCLLLPLHRSYMDFLLVSILCFHRNIQLPAVATGMDFMGI